MKKTLDELQKEKDELLAEKKRRALEQEVRDLERELNPNFLDKIIAARKKMKAKARGE